MSFFVSTRILNTMFLVRTSAGFLAEAGDEQPLRTRVGTINRWHIKPAADMHHYSGRTLAREKWLLLRNLVHIIAACLGLARSYSSHTQHRVHATQPQAVSD